MSLKPQGVELFYLNESFNTKTMEVQMFYDFLAVNVTSVNQQVALTSLFEFIPDVILCFDPMMLGLGLGLGVILLLVSEMFYFALQVSLMNLSF